MDKLKKLSSDLTTYSFFWALLANLLGIAAYALCRNVLELNEILSLITGLTVASACSYALAKLLVLASTQPLKAIWQAVWHITPNSMNIEAPNTEALTHGSDLATTLVRQIYALSGGKQTAPVQQAAAPATPILEYIPVPIIGFNKDGVVVVCNKIAADYIGAPLEAIMGKAFVDILPLSFQNKDTVENWLAQVRTTVATATNAWDRVRLQLPDEKGFKQFDLMARFSRDDPNGYETLLAFFDHTAKYESEDNSTAYVALAVHELRTPLTVLRGYIEVFEDELGEKLTPELKDFMHKMSASAQTLTAFVSNILNVARVDENQLNLSLHEANWNELIASIAKDLELRARVRGKTIKLAVTPGLPTVAVDKVSIYEVISNLVENAIKYSSDASEIVISAAVDKNGNVETVVEDHGVGIPPSAIDHLFTKFYRSHRSRGKVGGSGLGLYLVKAIVTAHGGEVWVQSQENVGSRFGFTLQPFAKVSSGTADANAGIEREAHGWIKNHSMYRR